MVRWETRAILVSVHFRVLPALLIALATTFAAPFALAIWIANAPTDEEPPLTKTVCPGSRLPAASTARELERKRHWRNGQFSGKFARRKGGGRREIKEQK